MKKHDKDDMTEVEPQSKAQEIFGAVLSWLLTISFGVLVGVFLVIFVVQRDNVYGDSMKPTLESGYMVFTEKISTYFDSYDRGDIVILDGSGMEGYYHDEYLIKRIVGMPGDTVKIENGKVYIKEAGQDEFYVLEEDYLAEGTSTDMMSWGLEKGYNEVILGNDEYYCMGDNRPVSNDSRNLGPFTEDRIKGVAFLVAYPFNEFGLI